MRRPIAVGGLLGALLWLVPGCSSNPGACQNESDCGAGEYCALGICKRPLGTTGPLASAASSTSSSTGGGTTGAATSGSASGGSTGFGTSTGSSTGTSSGGNGTTGGSSSGAGSTGSTSGGADAGNGVYCKPCTQQSDCGAIGNICYQLADGNDYCLTDCSQTMTCSEAGAFCVPIYALDGGLLGTDCNPGTDLCPTVSDGGTPDDGGGDPYCQPCTQPSDGGAAVCPGGAICVSFEYQFTAFCAPDCTATGTCSEAAASCEPLNNENESVCVPTSALCPGADPYCLGCNPENGNTNCGSSGAVCTTLDDVDYFCAPDCTKTQTCTEAGAVCEDGITDANGNLADGCEPLNEPEGICYNAPD